MELGERQDRESATMAQQDIKEATGYVKSILDSMIAEARAKYEEANKMVTDEVTTKLEDAKSQIDALSQEQMDQVQQMVDQAN
jgi:F0F1-type ATP synthase membrane subunit b/b'